jgi:hypothetical protein
MRGRWFRPSRGGDVVPSPAGSAGSAGAPPPMTTEEERQAFHSHSVPIPTRPIRTVLIDVGTDTQRGFWDTPLWLPIGGLVEGGPDLWEVVSVRLRLPIATGNEAVRPVLYLYARKAEA